MAGHGTRKRESLAGGLYGGAVVAARQELEERRYWFCEVCQPTRLVVSQYLQGLTPTLAAGGLSGGVAVSGWQNRRAGVYCESYGCQEGGIITVGQGRCKSAWWRGCALVEYKQGTTSQAYPMCQCVTRHRLEAQV